MWVDFISIEHLHQLKFKLYSPSGQDFILKWVATEDMAAERPEVAPTKLYTVNTCQMVGQFHLAGYKSTTPRLLSTQNFLLNNHM